MDDRDDTMLARAFAFLGNSLLKPMSQTSDAGLSPEFWESFPAGEGAAAKEAVDRCAAFAREAQARIEAGEDMVRSVSMEYTRLFVGPPRPAAAPWETAYRSAESPDGYVGFGEATVLMRRELSRLGLAQSNANNQYADHMGIELLCLSEMLRRSTYGALAEEEVLRFVRERPLSWCNEFSDRICAAKPDGYFASLASLVAKMLEELGARRPASSV